MYHVQTASPILSGNDIRQFKKSWNELEVDTQAGSSMTSSTMSVTSSEFESRSLDGDSAGRNSPPVETYEGQVAQQLMMLLKGDPNAPKSSSPEPTRTKLRAPEPTRTKLRSGAGLFVPGQSSLPQPPPPPQFQSTVCESAKVPVRSVNLCKGIIEGTFANRLCGIHLVETPSCTEVEVIVNPKPWEMYDAWNIDRQARSRALHLLLQAFKLLGPQVKALEPSADESKLTLKYSDASSDRLCWQFAQCGSCPRPNCRWEHVSMEVFIITIVMQPLVTPHMQQMAMSPQAGSAQCSFGEFANEEMPAGTFGYMIAAPMPLPMEQAPGMVYTVPASAVPTDAGPLPTLPPHSAFNETASGEAAMTQGDKNPAGTSKSQSNRVSRRERVCWADIEDIQTDDELLY